MPFLAGAVVVLAVLCLLNLLLTFGVIRKRRAQAAETSDRVVVGLIVPSGSTVPSFTAVTTTGERITRDGLGETMLGFFTPDCRACKERLPRFVEQARATAALTGRSVLAVVHGTPEEAREQVAALPAVAHVVVEEGDGPLGEAFDITGHPVFGLLTADGTLAATTFDPARLPAPARAAF
ncbi:peroxiredoxin family protein [Streptomyces sp. NPDC014006]|uniref:peroxiredoxin family protein n=1 Tax=Streptomyces sp. NPDC014006 TaxID=3364870 RepID=UPI0036F9773C